MKEVCVWSVVVALSMSVVGTPAGGCVVLMVMGVVMRVVVGDGCGLVNDVVVVVVAAIDVVAVVSAAVVGVGVVVDLIISHEVRWVVGCLLGVVVGIVSAVIIVRLVLVLVVIV